MLKKLNTLLVLLILPLTIAFSQDLTFQIDVITHMNTASQLLAQDNKLYAATSGGLLIYTINNGQEEITPRLMKYTTTILRQLPGAPTVC